jgi:hypothetical protein
MTLTAFRVRRYCRAEGKVHQISRMTRARRREIEYTRAHILVLLPYSTCQ